MTKARDLANIISGGFTADDIPDIPASKITSGTFADARIADLSASKLTGSIADARLPATALNSNVDLTNLSASNLTSGTIPTARITALPTGLGGKVINYYSNVITTSKSVSGSTTTAIQSPNITPSSTSSKFIITPTINWSSTNPNGAIFLYKELSGYNDLSPVQSISGHFGSTGNVKDLDEENGNSYTMETWSQTFIDSPNTTSQLNYTLRISAGSGQTVYVNRASSSDAYKAVSTISILELSS